MAKPTNHAPDSRTGNDDAPMQYPEGSVVAIADTVDQLEPLVEALASKGFRPSEGVVTYGEAAAERLRDSTGRTGLTGLAMRLAAALGMPDDETALKDRYEEALHDGRFVVLVLAPTEERKELAARLLETHGGHFVNFLGRFTIEAFARRTPAS
jgi:hypothetical protein